MLGLKTSTWFKTIIGRVFGSEKANKLMEKANTTASLATIFGFYTAPSYRFDNQNLQVLQSQFSKEEQSRFNALADQYEWKEYLQQIHLPGLHEYALAKKPVMKTKQNKTLKEAA